jgi:hypothetical protein
MPSNRFSKELIIDKYFKRAHGYLIIIFTMFAFFEIMAIRNGGHFLGGRISLAQIDLIKNSFGDYAKLADMMAIIIVVIFDAEIKFNRNSKEVSK